MYPVIPSDATPAELRRLGNVLRPMWRDREIYAAFWERLKDELGSDGAILQLRDDHGLAYGSIQRIVYTHPDAPREEAEGPVGVLARALARRHRRSVYEARGEAPEAAQIDEYAERHWGAFVPEAEALFVAVQAETGEAPKGEAAGG